MKYLLDANMVIALLNDRDSRPARRLRRHKPGDIAISAIVAHELYYGAFKSARPTQNVALIDNLRFPILEFDSEDARDAGELRAWLALRGTLIGPYDMLIAGQARARNLVLATRNTGEFRRVPGLKIEDWSS
jgi:tRNA(fMet)-specific endonuclease VapC